MSGQSGDDRDAPRATDAPDQADVTVARQVRLDGAVAAAVDWLSARWSMHRHALVAEIVSLELLGRLRTERLRAQRRLSDPWVPSPAGATALTLRWSGECDRALVRAAELDAIAPELTGLRLLKRHLGGHLPLPAAPLDAVAPPDPSLACDDESLSLHLPDALMTRLDEVASLTDLARNDVLRDTLMLHAFGRVRYEQWTQRGDWRPRRKATVAIAQSYRDGGIRFSRSRQAIDERLPEQGLPRPESGSKPAAGAATPVGTSPGDAAPREGARKAFIQAHGKSLHAVRVHLPARLKAGLDRLATLRREPLAEYCRRVLVAGI